MEKWGKESLLTFNFRKTVTNMQNGSVYSTPLKPQKPTISLFIQIHNIPCNYS